MMNYNPSHQSAQIFIKYVGFEMRRKNSAKAPLAEIPLMKLTKNTVQTNQKVEKNEENEKTSKETFINFKQELEESLPRDVEYCTPIKSNKEPEQTNEAKENRSPNIYGQSLKRFETQFRAFSKFGNPKSDGKTINLSQNEKWLKQAQVIDSNIITCTTAMIEFSKFMKHRLSLTEYKNNYLINLAKVTQMGWHDIVRKMCMCGPPERRVLSTSQPLSPTIQRLVDPQRYTGTHKQRFDEKGRGKGLAGRIDILDTSGYVNGYKHRNTFDTVMKQSI